VDTEEEYVRVGFLYRKAVKGTFQRTLFLEFLHPIGHLRDQKLKGIRFLFSLVLADIFVFENRLPAVNDDGESP